ncbi:MAG TPA: aspartate aminotransferase family protein [Candidatus Eisenbacteria bacterium]|nr:aspartate aminotransferase family protein [Candidatus Eisenbacteria bacterium]
MTALRGDELPEIRTPVPGPKSLTAAKRLRRVEGAAIWGVDSNPIVWARAKGAVVEDLDGNRFLDLTSGFGTASLGHAAPEIKRAVSAQAGRLVQGLGDLMPHRERERLVRALSRVGGHLNRVLLASTGSEAVELALKTAALATGRRRVVAFTGSYHGDSLGALEVTHHPAPPGPIQALLGGWAVHVAYGDLDALERALRESEPCAAVIAEPIQGRGGTVTPPPGFLAGLRALARKHGAAVIYDEVMTGAGRTGPFWAWERFGPDAEPDLLCAGKGIGGGMAIAALFGRPKLMDAWRKHAPASGEAPHASTFYAHPLACAGALATLKRLTAAGFREEVERKGWWLEGALTGLARRHRSVAAVRTAGLMAGIELASDAAGLQTLWRALLARGVLTIPSGTRGTVLQLLPPFTITDEQLAHGVTEIDSVLAG